MNRILVIRFSSMGDVLLTAPVIVGALKSNPELEIDLVTRKQFAGYFQNIERLHLIEADTSGSHKGFRGIRKLQRDIRINNNYSTVLDLHSVLRSRILCSLFKLSGAKIYRIDKGRKEKRQYLKGRIRKELKHTVDRYKDVFTGAGVELELVYTPFRQESRTQKTSGKKKIQIGVAPFARHEAKSWPLDYMLALMTKLSGKLHVSFHIYGGKDDLRKLKDRNFDEIDVKIHAGKMNPEEEMDSISGLDLFISMDSANMHLADLLGIPVISIWGGTHPDLGFRPFNQDPGNIIQTKEILTCRPCSVFGGKACKLHDSKHKCLLSIPPEQVATKILESFSS